MGRDVINLLQEIFMLENIHGVKQKDMDHILGITEVSIQVNFIMVKKMVKDIGKKVQHKIPISIKEVIKKTKNMVTVNLLGLQEVNIKVIMIEI